MIAVSVIAAPSEVVISPWREVLEGVPGIEFRIAKMPAAADGCDAAIVPSYLALDRYGGRPRSDAQIRENHRVDGLPDFIVVTPSYGPVVGDVDSHALADPIYEIFVSCLRSIEDFNRTEIDRSIVHLLVHVVALGFEAVDDVVVATAFRRAWREFGH
ncbi:hypothetical protein ABZV58_04715 [Nocardia sp. NPDC004654]|uniref:hypothetical protein n=1 Tax=Nocardia sp. NPDC004654 TaxID=3154776 RepID=UPI0033AD1A58